MRKFLFAVLMMASMTASAQISLAELLETADEVTVYVALNDVKPEVVQANLQYYREQLLKDLHEAGYHPTFDCWIDLLFLPVFDELGHIVKRNPKVIGKEPGKTTFWYEDLSEE